MEKYKIKLEFEEFTIKDETKKNDIKIYMTKGEKGDAGGIDKNVDDLVNYYTKTDTDTLLTEKANVNDIPASTSDLVNDSGFISQEIDPIYSSSAASEITSNDITNWNNKSDFSGDYNDLTNKPVIPDVSNYVTKDTNELENYTLTNDLSSVATSNDYDDLDNKPSLFSGDYNDLTNKPTLFSGNYNDLTNKPNIPSKTSDLTNDNNFIDNTVNNLVNYTKTSSLSNVATSGSYNDLSNKPTIPDVSNFITKDVNDLTYYTKSSDLSTVATSGSYNDLTNTPTIPDVSNFITKDVNDLTNYTLTSNLSTVATSGDYQDLSNTPDLTEYEEATNKVTSLSSSSSDTEYPSAKCVYDYIENHFPDGMYIMSYGHSTWNDFITAYQKRMLVYCRASSSSNPASGSQTRMAFMAYVNNADNPTEVEFQYYRSVSSHSLTQQSDQVYVYKLNKTNGWSVTVREAFPKIAVGTGLKLTYSSNTLTISLDQ